MNNFKIKRRGLFLWMILAAIFLSSFKVVNNYNFKTIFVYNFTKYIKWPHDPQKIQIGIFSDNPKVKEAFDLMAKKKSNEAKSFEILDFKPDNSLKEIEIVFVAEDKTRQLSSVNEIYKGKNTLIVTESPGAIEKGSCINFIYKDEKLKFELKEKRLVNSGLMISKQLLSLAIVK